MTALPIAEVDATAARPRVPGLSAAGTLPLLGGDIMVKVRHAYQRDGRLAAAATVRQHNPGLSMTDALWAIDRALGLRKASAIY